MIINHHEIPIFKPCIALIIGILLSQFIPVELRISGILIYVILFFFGVQLVSKKKIDHHIRNGFVLFLIVCFGACLVQEKNPEIKSFPYDVDSTSLTIRVNKILPHKKHKKLIGTILSYLNQDSTFTESSGNIMIYFEGASIDTSIRVGQEYFAKGNLSTLSQIPNPYAFDYALYLNREGIYHQLFVKQKSWQYLRNNRRSYLYEIVAKLQNHFKRIIGDNFTDSSNRALVNAMVLGDRNELSQDQKDTFINTGAIHVLAVSGLHVGILCLFLGYILKLIEYIIPIPKIIQGLIIICCLWLFALITGSSSAVLRAALMFSMFYLSRDILHRHVSIYNIIFGSAFLLLLFDPMQVFKVSFQFSYLAVLSIVFFFPYVNNWIQSQFKLVNYFWSSIAIGISAQVLVFPISIFYFNKFASSFLITSIFVVQLAMIVLIATLIILILDTIGLSFVSQKVLSPITNWVLDLFQNLITKVQDLPYSYIENIWIDKVQLLSIYLLLLSLMLLIKQRKVKYFIGGISVIVFFVLQTKFSNHLYSIQHCAFIYNDKNGSVDIFVGNNCFSLSPDTEEGNSFVYGRNRMANKIDNCEQLDESTKENAVEYKDGVLRLGKLFLAYANVSTFTEVRSTKSYSYLLVNKENAELVKIDPRQLTNTEIILDTSLAPWIRNDLIIYCKKHGLSFYDIKKQGAKKIEF